MELQKLIVVGIVNVGLGGCVASDPPAGEAAGSSSGDEEESRESSTSGDGETETEASATGGEGASSPAGEGSSSPGTTGGTTGEAAATSAEGTTTGTGPGPSEDTGDSVAGSEATGDPIAEGESGDPFMGTCTPSVSVMSNASGSGPHDVTVETNADPGINEGTIFRPTDLDDSEPYPIFVWAEGGCSLNGLSNAAAMAEIASHGYFVVADGTPNGSGSRTLDMSDVVSMGAPLIAYIDWAIAENEKPCSAYYRRLDPTKVSSNGFSCGGLMAAGTAGDPRLTTWGHTSSGTFSANPAFYAMVHTPVLIVEGGPSDIAYENGLRDYENISAIDVPLMWFSKDIGHGGDLGSGGDGDFTKINLAWLNWWLKGDEGPTGKGLLTGADCPYCTDPEWEVMSSNVP